MARMMLSEFQRMVGLTDCSLKFIFKKFAGVNIHGLFVQGCKWEWKKSVLAESNKGELFEEMPVIWYYHSSIRSGSDSSV